MRVAHALKVYIVVLQLLKTHAKEEAVSIRKLDTVEEVLKESDVSNCPTQYSIKSCQTALKVMLPEQKDR